MAHTCGLKTDGSVVCWGSNDYRQAMPPDETFQQVSAGGVHTCGVKTNGQLVCWGNNTNLIVGEHVGASHAAGGKLSASQRWYISYLRGEDQRAGRLLGR